MTSLCVRALRLALAAGIASVAALAQVHAQVGQVQGQTASRTATLPPVNPHPQSRDDTDTVTTNAIQGLATSALINQSAAAFQMAPNTQLSNLVYAGAAGVGQNFTPINLSDFNLTTYQPWVVNSNATMNNLRGPDNSNNNRGVTDQDAGGVNFVLTYTPANGDPRTVNFLQAFSVTTASFNGGNPFIAMDNGGRGGPFYNENGAAGINNMGKNVGNPPLVIPANTPQNMNNNAWMLDIPFICESGFGGGTGCPATTPQTDETITRYVDIFDVFIEAPQVFRGTTYQVLFGGFQWGFTYTATDIPESSTWAMLLVGFAGLGLASRLASRKGAAA